MGYEIDFLPVGDGSKGGDAIALRYGNLFGRQAEQKVIVIDGGYKDDGEALVEHIHNYYDTDRVDIVVSTHPDQDHISGLEVVLRKMDVQELWMHLPWKHSASLAAARNFNFRSSVIKEQLRASLQGAVDLEGIAREEGVSIVEPFAGHQTSDGAFKVLGPSIEYYEELLREIMTPGTAKASDPTWEEILHKLLAARVSESLTEETLSEDTETSSSNNTSAICLLEFDGRRSLFTGDAGIPALNDAIDELEAAGFTAGDLRFVQVPHHGSQRNVSPSLLNRLLGPKGQTQRIGTAFASVPPENPKGKHPSKKSTNAFLRRGYPVHLTQGTSKWHHHNAPGRSNYTTSIPEPLHESFDEGEGK
ncbi:ComEC/Rec2 family competence protein [Streptomyces sp. NPDC054940]